jgi:prepilin-type N-terminal cleavage/methylation domain-containing protein
MEFTRQHKPAFTLIELTLTVAIVGMLMAGLASAVVLAARALPDPNRPSSNVLEQGRALDRIAADLQYAKYITERGAHAVTFTVADRDGNGSPECLRYAWSGSAGAPLTLEYNHGSALTVLENVQQFDLNYVTKSVAESYAGLPVEGSELLVASYPTAVSSSDFAVDDKDWIGQFIKPSAGILPVDTLTWRLTRVQFRAKSDGAADAVLGVQIRAADPNKIPTTSVLEEELIAESSLPSSYTWKEATFDSVAGIKLDQGVCLVLRRASGPGKAAKINYDGNAGAGRLTTGNSGGSWTYDSNKSMVYYAYGKPSIPGPLQMATRQFVTGVYVTLRAGSDNAAQLDTLVRTLNVPEVLSAVWELDFASNPTTMDMNGDGVGDWVTADASAFNPVSLGGGVWNADRALDTNPGSDFTQLTNIEVSFRDNTATGDGAGVWAHIDRSGNTYGVVYATVAKQTGGTQTLTVCTRADAGSSTPLVQVTNLSADFVNLRLLVDPALDTVNVHVNGLDTGTFTYPRYSDNTRRLIELYPAGSDTGARFDSVRVRVGGN